MMLSKDITTFQLKAARAGLGLSISDLHNLTGISRATITRIEKQPINEPPICSPITVYHLRQFFEAHGVVFESENKISLVSNN